MLKSRDTFPPQTTTNCNVSKNNSPTPLPKCESDKKVNITFHKVSRATPGRRLLSMTKVFSFFSTQW